MAVLDMETKAEVGGRASADIISLHSTFLNFLGEIHLGRGRSSFPNCRRTLGPDGGTCVVLNLGRWERNTGAAAPPGCLFVEAAVAAVVEKFPHFPHV